MKKILYFTFLLTPWLLLAGCLNDMSSEYTGAGAGIKTMTVKIVLPEILAMADLTDSPVEFLNNTSGVIYHCKADSEGKASQQLEYGSYTVSVSHSLEVDGGGIFLLNGSMSMMVTEDNSASADFSVSATPKGTIIFKEIYFYRSRNALGANGPMDQYFTIVNNSDEVEYLDGIGIGTHNTFNSGTSTNYAKAGSDELRDSIPVYGLGFIFPGDGDDYPLNPGEERHIALNAINWFLEPNPGPDYVDLSDPNKVWALYDEQLYNQKLPAPGVPRMTFYTNVGSASVNTFTISNSSPCVVLYRIQGDPDKTPLENAQAYVAGGPVKGQPGNVIYNPPLYQSGTPAIFLPKEWIFDGMEIKRDHAHLKRLRPEIDNGYVYGDGQTYSAKSYVRKIDEEASAAAGRTIYMDTNNSSVDWEIIDHPLLANPR